MSLFSMHDSATVGAKLVTQALRSQRKEPSGRYAVESLVHGETNLAKHRIRRPFQGRPSTKGDEIAKISADHTTIKSGAQNQSEFGVGVKDLP